MDRVIVERAVRALAALNACPGPETRSSPVPVHASANRATPLLGERQAGCGSPRCAGCYDVGDGRKIHPPKCGEEYRACLELWETKGRVQ
jgi:hypothetical protein